MKKLLLLFSIVAVVACSGCRHKGDSESTGFPADFNSLSDARKVEYVMAHATPDSVARFLCLASIGRVEGVSIDTLPLATAYVYDHYNDADRDSFGIELDRFAQVLSLGDRMKLYLAAGTEDPQGLGYELGLEYMNSIREQQMTLEQVEREINAFREACGNDSNTYQRFMVGFKTVLRIDRGKDVPEDIYKKFVEE